MDMDFVSREYCQQVINDIKDSPEFEKGMHVDVFNHDDDSTFKGSGVVEEVLWSEFYFMHMLHVQMDDGKFEHGIMAWQCKRTTVPAMWIVK